MAGIEAPDNLMTNGQLDPAKIAASDYRANWAFTSEYNFVSSFDQLGIKFGNYDEKKLREFYRREVADIAKQWAKDSPFNVMGPRVKDVWVEPILAKLVAEAHAANPEELPPVNVKGRDLGHAAVAVSVANQARGNIHGRLNRLPDATVSVGQVRKLSRQETELNDTDIALGGVSQTMAVVIKAMQGKNISLKTSFNDMIKLFDSEDMKPVIDTMIANSNGKLNKKNIAATLINGVKANGRLEKSYAGVTKGAQTYDDIYDRFALAVNRAQVALDANQTPDAEDLRRAIRWQAPAPPSA
ncbi:MAG TPA: hypothetical protein VHB73_04915 [Alphaproteobacteria bacterium]|nr:hypothetical protein [Alphaproteobacteria bacterium]